MAHKKIALVTGGNKGMGFEMCRQLAQKNHFVYLGARDPVRGQAAAKQLSQEGLEVHFLPLDVASPESIEKAFKAAVGQQGRLDVLVNNAGIFIDPMEDALAISEKHLPNERAHDILRTFQTNTLGSYLLCQWAVPLMLKNQFGRVVNFSSGMGALTEMNGGYPAYRISKTALNAVTRIFADETLGSNVLINSLCPGWVKTEMGGESAERTVQEGVDTAIWLATLPDQGPTGGFFRDRKPIDW